MKNLDSSVIWWVRNDLRLRDNEALMYAISLGDLIVPVFILEETFDGWGIGKASRWWLHNALEDFQKQLEGIGLKLILRKGKSEHILGDLGKNMNANYVIWNRSYDEGGMEGEARVSKKMSSLGVKVKTFKGNVLFEPGSILNKTKKPFRVFTPFYNCVKDIEVEKSVVVSKKNLKMVSLSVDSEPLESFGLLCGSSGCEKFSKHWDPSISGGEKLLEEFIDEKIRGYSVCRDFPGEEGTSRLSPYLHFGQISVKQIRDALVGFPVLVSDPYYRQIIWREFAWAVLYYFPEIASCNFRKEFDSFKWQGDVELLKCWQEGMTGYPIVDAGMRELKETGWMHNRVRMIVGSFLVKNLMIHWLEGARWFWENLVDADLANNSFGWQWVAGCGLDASPFFRVFNPILQSQKFDPQGTYIKRYVYELRGVPHKWIHAPWTAKNVQIGVRVGVDYPEPIVSYLASRINVLRAYNQIRALKLEKAGG